MAATATTAPVREREVADSRQGVARVHDDENDDDESVESVPQKRSGGNNDEEDRARAQRDRLRAERRREREKEYRLERAGMTNPDDDAADEELKKKRRLENDRDVSEKVALGTHTGSGAAGGAGGIDSRLYSQSAGLSSGFGADDEYNAYSRPMFDREGVTSSSIYRPTRDLNTEDADAQYEKLKKGATGKFVPDKGFGGAEGDKNGGMGGAAGGAARTAPVQFEKGN